MHRLNKWKLHVEGFGKIKEADIEVGPFTMFTGDNNSGKSYLMTLIWGIRSNKIAEVWANENDGEILEKIGELESYKKLKERIQNFFDVSSKYEDVVLNNAEVDDFVLLYNDLLKLYKEKFVQRLFGSEIVQVEHIDISYKCEHKISISKGWRKDDIESFIKDLYGENGISKEQMGIQVDLLATMEIFRKLFEGKPIVNRKEVDAYLPTSRTGFILTYKILIDSVLRPLMYGKSTNSMNLTLPCMNLIQNINWVDNSQNIQEYSSIVDFMEKHISSGKMILSDNMSTEFYYLPNENPDTKLPMKLCSGVVTETVLVIMFLKHLGLASVFIEEPEMCLHPELQWQYARAFIKMYNKGLPICMATHSDIFMAQVNNMIKLNNHLEKEILMKEYGYEEDDLISAEDVKVYHFDVQEDGMTKIIQIQADEDGFQVPSFQKALRELLDQSMAFEMEE